MLGPWLKSNDRQYQLVILALAVFLIFFRLDRADMQTDGATYSLRALGYLDYLNADVQTTPLQWFGEQPWWTKLSFHDAPPLVPLIQFAFFSLFGRTTLVSRLPGALAGVLTVVLVMAVARRLAGKRTAAIAGVFLASSTLFTWAAREPYLESVTTLFVVLSFWCFYRAFDNPRWWVAWGASLGAALLSKYTAALLIPACVGYLLIAARPVFRQPRFWMGVVVSMLMVSPVVLYNVQLYRTRGHFDVQLSKLVPSTWTAAATAWPKLYADIGKPKPLAEYAVRTFQYFQATTGAPWFWLGAAASAWWTWRLLRQRQSWRDPLTVVWLSLAVFSLLLVLHGPAPRFLPPAVPLVALLTAVVVARIRRFYLPAVMVMLVLVVTTEVVFNFNTNHASRPAGAASWQLPTLRLGNDGYQQLAVYLEPILRQQPGYGFRPVRSSADLISDFDAIAGQDVFIYQNDLRWFSTLWYFQQYSIYHRVYFIGDRDLAALARERGEAIRVVNFFLERQVRRLYFIAGANSGVYEAGVDATQVNQRSDLEQAFADNLARGAPGGVVEIKNAAGQAAFKVYALDFAVVNHADPR